MGGPLLIVLNYQLASKHPAISWLGYLSSSTKSQSDSRTVSICERMIPLGDRYHDAVTFSCNPILWFDVRQPGNDYTDVSYQADTDFQVSVRLVADKDGQRYTKRQSVLTLYVSTGRGFKHYSLL
jgi:hypothetical protein